MIAYEKGDMELFKFLLNHKDINVNLKDVKNFDLVFYKMI